MTDKGVYVHIISNTYWVPRNSITKHTVSAYFVELVDDTNEKQWMMHQLRLCPNSAYLLNFFDTSYERLYAEVADEYNENRLFEVRFEYMRGLCTYTFDGYARIKTICRGGCKADLCCVKHHRCESRFTIVEEDYMIKWRYLTFCNWEPTASLEEGWSRDQSINCSSCCSPAELAHMEEARLAEEEQEEMFCCGRWVTKEEKDPSWKP